MNGKSSSRFSRAEKCPCSLALDIGPVEIIGAGESLLLGKFTKPAPIIVTRKPNLDLSIHTRETLCFFGAWHRERSHSLMSVGVVT